MSINKLENPNGPENPDVRPNPDGDSPPDEPQSSLDFPVVGVGASAGGMEAFAQLLESLPADSGMGFILVLHLDPHHESIAASILAQSTAMSVVEASDGMPVQPNQVYVIPPGATMALADGHLEVRPRSPGRAPHMPIDHLFRSLAKVQGNKAIGVVLSGGGTDGTLGLEEISAAEGVTFAQEEHSAKHDSMPRSAIGAGCIDFVLTPDKIAGELLRIAGHVCGDGPAGPIATIANDKEALGRILDRLRQSGGIDFSQYKQTTVQRRIHRRMGLRQLDTLPAYAKFLEEEPMEVQALHQDLLIRVTSFFRDPAAFKALEGVVLPRILEDRAPDSPVRIWIAGCASGEEVYSIAMLLLEHLGDRAASVPIKLLASDINETALEKARAGMYLENIQQDVTPERLRRFFTKVDRHYQINKSIRDLCVFSRHNLVRDPPFSHVDLVTCRNLLIYLGTPLQKRVMPIFHYALKPTGYLMLGTSETVGSLTTPFQPVDEKHKIYAKKGRVAAQTVLELEPVFFSADHPETARAQQARREAATFPEVHKEADRLVLQRFAPAGVIIDEHLNVVQFRGQTGPFLEHPPGMASLNLLKLAREGLLVGLRAALGEVQTKNAPVHKEGVAMWQDGGFRTVNLHLMPLHSTTPMAARYYLVLFEEVHQAPPTPSAPAASANVDGAAQIQARVEQLQQELDATREFLQTTLEEHESASEELKSANEEILSSNEELQSTNEELQSAKEELQSSNEELTTVNEEVHRRNAELARLNDELINLFAGVNLPVVMVDRDLKIRKLTPLADQVFNLIPADVGRSLSVIRPNINIPEFDHAVLDVIHNLEGKELEAQDRAGKWYSVRILPYFTQDKRIEGASIVAFDIDPLKRSLDQAQQLVQEQAARTGAELANRAKDEFLAMLAHELRNGVGPMANALQTLAQAGLAKEEGVRMLDIAQRQARNLARLVDDLLDVSRISRGKIRLQTEPIAVDTLVRRIIASTRSLFETTGHELETALPPEPVWLVADSVRLEQVLYNLLSNAVKYTPPGGKISLSVARTPDHQVEFRVKDSGIGIAPEMLPRVFDLFSQGEQALDRSQGGLGIGLTLVKRLVELHGGTVLAISEGVNKGSEFIIRLPALAKAPAAPPAGERPPAPAEVPARNLLIVDDNPDAAESLAMLLRLSGHSVRVAPNGPLALQAAQASVPDVVLLDIGLPGMDGYTVARQLRQLPGMDKALLVAITGYGRDEDRQRSHEAGFDHHLVKPVDIGQLQELLK